MTSISIIGTAGRNDDAAKLNQGVFTKMNIKVNEILCDIGSREDRILVSGGAAWADHVAVIQYLNGFAKQLILHLPAKFDMDKRCFVGSKDAEISNYYHKKFSDNMGVDSLFQLWMAIDQKAVVCNWPGFKARNSRVAKSQYIIALTYNNGNIPKDGGTKHTWDMATTPNKIHIDIGSL